MRFTTVILLVIAHFACKSAQNKAQTPEKPQESGPLVQLESGACRGFCPVYVILVNHDGSARYEGRRFVEKTGELLFQLSEDELSSLKKSVAAANLWQYPERIPSHIVDAPVNGLTVYKSEANHTVWGTVDRPQSLLDLEQQIKKIAKNHGLEVEKGVDPSEIPDKDRKEVVVLLKDDLNAGNWIRQFSEFRLQLIRRTGTLNQWRVGYDSKQIQEKTLLELLKNSDGVIEVTPQR